MAEFLSYIKKFITYKEPKDIDDFELLESEHEGTDQDGLDEEFQKEQDKKSNQDKDKDEKNEKKKNPLKVDEWNKTKNKSDDKSPQSPENMVDPQLKINLEHIQKVFISDKNSDIIIRQFKIAQKIEAFIVFIDGMVDRETINNYILRQLMKPELFENYKGDRLVEFIDNNVLSVHDTKKETKYDMIIGQICNGLTVLFIDGCSECLMFETRGYEKRSVEKPATEAVIGGPQEGFNENLRTNITLIRRIVKNHHLVTEILPLGKTNHSFCAVMYVDGISNPKVIKEVKRRINSLDTDYIQSDGILEQLIEDSPLMLLPQVLRTERPDRASSFLMEGRVVIVADGAPFIIAVPATFFSMLQTTEESNLKWQQGTLLKLIRLFGMFVAILLPGLWIALTLYHQEMIPTDLLSSIAMARENVPFPILVEVMLMEVSFELIREAGIRVAGITGTTLGMIGGLIMGQAAVTAGIVSPILIVVVAVTGLGNFAIPNYSLALSIRISRFLFIVLGALAGFYGISVGIFVLGGLVCSMKSFGVPFLSPIAPKTKGNSGLALRMPAFSQKERPDFLNTLDRKRTGENPRGWIKRDKGGEKN
ncbi:MAG: spore germination protein [Firmicutes bacterium]|nr:spore germination protein [Bacillota bacterium]